MTRSSRRLNAVKPAAQASPASPPARAEPETTHLRPPPPTPTPTPGVKIARPPFVPRRSARLRAIVAKVAESAPSPSLPSGDPEAPADPAKADRPPPPLPRLSKRMKAVLATAPTPQDDVVSIAPVSEIEGAPSILVVDDDDATRRLLVRALRTTYTVYEAADGEQALALLEQQIAIDCVISDIMMPRLSGTDLARRMRQDARLKKVPIIFVTAKRGAGDIAEACASSKFYLTKPFSLTALYGRVGEALGQVTKR